MHVFETVKSYPCKEYDIQVALNMKLHYLMHVHYKNMKKNCLTSITKMLHVFPEVDSKHSESEWNQDSDYTIVLSVFVLLSIFRYSD